MNAEILMCPPDFFGIEYEINPWMNREKPVDHGRATAQWNELRDILSGLGADIQLLKPVEGMPDLVFTANAGLVYRDRIVLSRFRHAQRQDEEAVDEDWFKNHGFTVEKLPPGRFFEGAGDALFCGEVLFAGYRIRSDVRGHHLLGELLACRVIPVELVDDYYYHLDTCFCPLAPGVAIYYPGAFDEYGRKALDEYVDELLPVTESEARSFACNAVVVGDSVVTNVGCPQLQSILKANGFTPIATPLGEFVKSGGSAKCLTLRLDGEEAATWKAVEGECELPQ